VTIVFRDRRGEVFLAGERGKAGRMSLDGRALELFGFPGGRKLYFTAGDGASSGFCTVPRESPKLKPLTEEGQSSGKDIGRSGEQDFRRKACKSDRLQNSLLRGSDEGQLIPGARGAKRPNFLRPLQPPEVPSCRTLCPAAGTLED